MAKDGVSIEELRELIEHRTRKLDAARLGVSNERIIAYRKAQLNEAQKQLAAALAAQRN